MRPFIKTILILVPALLYAQPETATLRGVVTGTAGAVVPNVQVTIHEAGKELSVRAISSDARGRYDAPLLKPGTYTIKFDGAHFQVLETEGVTLIAGQVRILDVEVKPESGEDSEQSSEAARPAQTQSPTVTGHVDFRKLWQDSPFMDLHPSVLPLLTTAPATQGNANGLVISGVSSLNQQSWSVDGLPQDTTPQTSNPAALDSIEVTIANPGVETAKPVRVESVSKRGADGIHGILYYKRASSAFNSKAYFDTDKSSYRANEAEGELGGNLIPRWTYFYGGAIYQRTPYNQTFYSDVPTTQMRNLDFGQFLSASTAPNGKVVIVRDPRNGAPFPNNAIPVNRRSGVANNYLSSYYPVANTGTANTFTQNFQWQHPYGSESYIGNWPFARIDQRISANNQAYFRWMQNQTATIAPGSVNEPLSSTQTTRYRGFMFSLNSTMSSRVTNQMSFGRTTNNVKQGESENKFNPLHGDTVVSTVGLQGVNPNSYATMGFATVNINGLTPLSMQLAGGHAKDTARDDTVWSYQDSLIWQLGRHSVKLGGQYQGYDWLEGAVPQTVYGAFTFTGEFTGLGFADFMLGLPATSTRQAGRVDRTLHQSQAGLFLSDTWRATSRLTLDFGVRWDYYTTPVYDDGYMSNWDPATNQVIVAPGTLTAVSSFFPKSATVVIGDVVPKANTSNFRPRVGAAYRLSDHLVLRGGYGEYTENVGYGTGGRLSPTNPYGLTETYTNSITNGVAALSFPRPFPTTPSANQLPGQNITALPKKTEEGVIRQFNATLDASVHGFALRFSYIGARGMDLNYKVDINKPRASTTAFTTARKPYPTWASAYEVRNDGKWKYNSGVISAQRWVGPIGFHSSFTYGKSETNYANTVDPYNVTNQWTRDAANRERYFNAGAIIPLPFGRGRHFASQVGGFKHVLISDWQVQVLTTFASGQYYSPAFTGADPANATQGFVTQLPDCVGDPNSGARTVSQWFNPAAFVVPPATAGRYGTCAMNSLEGFPIHIGHASVVKQFALGESVKLIFTTQISNLTNSPHFTFPNNNISTPNPGVFSSTSVASSASAERLANRRIDFKLRLVF
ncbi:MAG: TonB-dependent receptor [Candidatus Solibacter sp.]